MSRVLLESVIGLFSSVLHLPFTGVGFGAHSIQIPTQLGHKIEVDYSKNRSHIITTQTKEKIWQSILFL